jgi:hypothetical protein
MSTSKTKTTRVPATRRRHAFTAPLIAVATATLLFAGTGAAHAADDPNPVGNLVKKVDQSVSGAVKQNSKASVPSQNAPDPAPSNDSDSPGHETPNPQAPDHGSSYVGHGELAGQDLIDVGHGTSTVNDDGSTSADSTLLAVGGQEIVGSHASSDGRRESHGAAPAIPACEQSSGAVCLDLLYSDSYATDNGSSSDSRTDNGVANLCVGGSDPTGATCDAPVGATIGDSQSHAHRNQITGRTTASSNSELLSICLQRDPITHLCTVNADALSSHGDADSDGDAHRSSDVANLDFPGSPAGQATQPFAVSVPMDCTSPSALCVFGNQGETYLGQNLVGTSQSALDIFALDRNLFVGLAHSETLVHNSGARPPVVSPPKVQAPKAQPPAVQHTVAKVVDGVLPNTGGVWSGLLALGLGLFAAGAMATAWDRRRARVA